MIGMDFGNWTIPKELWETIRPMLRPGMVTLETGSGLSTLLLEAAGCRHTALEHDRRFAAASDSVVLAPLLGDPPWYDWEPPGFFDLVLVDGPPRHAGGRAGIERVIDRLVHRETVLVLDDTNRADENHLAARLARRLGLRRTDHRTAGARCFAVLEPVKQVGQT